MSSRVPSSREKWYAKNISNKILNVGDMPLPISLRPGQSLDLLNLYTKDEISNSRSLKTMINKGWIRIIKELDGSTESFNGSSAMDSLTSVEVNELNAGGSASSEEAQGGYEFTGGFTDRTTGLAGQSDIGTDVDYTAELAASDTWYRFGFNAANQITNDQPYWADSSNPLEAPHSGTTDYQGVGLFSGAYMPAGVNSLFNFTDNTAYNAAKTEGDLLYTAGTGSYNMSELNPGDLCLFRFDFNLTPTQSNTTVEVGLIWQTRDSDDNETFTFALTGEPIFFGNNTASKTFLNRPIISAYLASQEDVNARALPAIRASQAVLVQPLTTLFTVVR